MGTMQIIDEQGQPSGRLTFYRTELMSQPAQAPVQAAPSVIGQVRVAMATVAGDVRDVAPRTDVVCDGESFEELHRRFKRGVDAAGVLREARRRRHFIPKHERRREWVRTALRRRQRAA